MRFVAGEIVEDVQNPVARDRVQPAGRLVEDEQARTVRERGSQRQLHPHPARQAAHRLACRERKAVEQRRIRRSVPAGVGAG